MKRNQPTISKWWQQGALLASAALVLAACGGNEEPTPTPATAPATATSAPAPATAAPETSTPETASSAAESPLAQPESPLGQPDSPLTTAATAAPAQPDWPRSEEEAIAVAGETTVPEPQEGMGAIGGVIYYYGIKEAVPGTQFYLTAVEEVDGEFVPPSVNFGPRLEMGDIVGTTTMQGQVQLDNVPPGNYFMLLWTVYNWLSVYPSEGAPAPLLITIEEGDQLDLGVIYTNWP